MLKVLPLTHYLTDDDNIIIIISGRRRELCDGAVTHDAPPIRHPATNDIGRTGPSGRYVGTPPSQQQQRHHGGTDTPAAAAASHRLVALRTAHTTSPLPSLSSAFLCVRLRARPCVCECQQLAATVNRAQQSHTASVRGPPSVVFGRTSLQRVVVTAAYAATACFSVVTHYFSTVRFLLRLLKANNNIRVRHCV